MTSHPKKLFVIWNASYAGHIINRLSCDVGAGESGKTKVHVIIFLLPVDIPLPHASFFKMDTKNENKRYRQTPEFAEYQRENFWKSNDGQVPVFNTGMLR